MYNILVSACLLGVNCRYNGIKKENTEVLRLLELDGINLVPVCPEQMGGMATPRRPSEQRGRSVVNDAGEDVTAYFQRGAEEVLHLAGLYHCPWALLKERSPSCGCGEIYDGTFSGKIISGDGVTAELLRKSGIEIFGESEIDLLRKSLFKHTQSMGGKDNGD